METINCIADRITFQNDENGFTVLRAHESETHETITLVGIMPDVSQGTELEVHGDWKFDTRYGPQFQVSYWEEKLPLTCSGIEKYLASGFIKGIGPVTARKIVEKFGEETFAIIDRDPERLREIGGIGEAKLAMITESWSQHREIQNIVMFLQKYEISSSFAGKIYKQYGNSAISKIQENPYQLANDIWGIGFHTADEIASKLGIPGNSPIRYRSGILYALRTMSEEGHCYATKEQLLQKSQEILGAGYDDISKEITQLILQKEILEENNAIYLPVFYHTEVSVAKHLAELMAVKEDISYVIDFDTLEKITKISFDATQREAIDTAVNSKIMILTGGPGTGKTTTTVGIISTFLSLGKKILLAAPTGRAAKRLSEATGREAKTIHRLLEASPNAIYKKNENNPLSGDVLIVDECSMIDIMLMNALVKALPSSMHLILVGDADQLPSVGPGNVLQDIIESGCFPVVSLREIHRQAKSSRIITNAHLINEGQFPVLSNKNGTDFFFIEKNDPQDAADEIVNLVLKRLPSYTGLSPMSIQVLSPMRRGPVGTDMLNQKLQDALNPSSFGLRRNGSLFRVGDKVMQIRNDYDRDVYNGDVGFIQNIDMENSSVSIIFDEKIVEYDTSELDEIMLAYAVTIHKSQGSEYPVVVLPLMMTHYIMLQRNLLYTGITRAKKCLVLIGSKKSIGIAIRNARTGKRNSMLKERIQSAVALLQTT